MPKLYQGAYGGIYYRKNGRKVYVKSRFGGSITIESAIREHLKNFEINLYKINDEKQYVPYVIGCIKDFLKIYDPAFHKGFMRYLQTYSNHNSRQTNINVVNYISILLHILTYNEQYNKEYSNANEIIKVFHTMIKKKAEDYPEGSSERNAIGKIIEEIENMDY